MFLIITQIQCHENVIETNFKTWKNPASSRKYKYKIELQVLSRKGG